MSTSPAINTSVPLLLLSAMLIAAYINIQYHSDTSDCMQSSAIGSVISQSLLSCPQRNLACLIACNMAHLPSTAVSLHAPRQSRPVVAAAATSVHPCTGLLLDCDETDSLLYPRTCLRESALWRRTLAFPLESSRSSQLQTSQRWQLA
jgi:hypothetical protein